MSWPSGSSNDSLPRTTPYFTARYNRQNSCRSTLRPAPPPSVWLALAPKARRSSADVGRADMAGVQTLANESCFGPPSELISIAAFVEELVHADSSRRIVFAQSADSLPENARQGWAELPAERRASIADECRIACKICTSPCMMLSRIRALWAMS